MQRQAKFILERDGGTEKAGMINMAIDGRKIRRYGLGLRAE